MGADCRGYGKWIWIGNIKAEETKRFMQNTRRKEGKVRDQISETFIFQFPKEEEAEDE